ncbi:flagellar hook-basal body complex protein FliE [Rehaibacterium terrae]|jgi:flagellar hook-basal body complex protein FliE|uniref:Flagellar hook-basal body complex protein FliE n=1 Tax=Rehaibacterium terrae TaxID=1341696 RepID=A0A7W8DFZ7_9GAMM|nr:flagellar hook-basal body complex protein FliE [Rehaibacterium terrae]MBB5016729.1 flagellar hook-basal body complex protein FliE [Rehaibacterium terrae]
MSDAIASVLSQIRALQAQTRITPPGLESAAPVATGPSFGDTLKRALSGVNESQMESRRLAEAFELGDPRVDLARVMIASQQAQVGFKAVVEVRNRMVQAYQDVMNMPI